MHNVDFLIVGIYLIVMFVIGILMKGKAAQSITSYFVADRSLPGWWSVYPSLLPHLLPTRP